MTPLTRRGVLAGSAAALTPTGSAPATPVCGAHPDADLIDLCSRFDALERRFLSFYRGGSAHIESDDERDIAQAPIVDEQEALLPRIFELPPSTHEGMVAIARSLALWDAELVKVTPGGNSSAVLIATLVRGLIGGAA